MRTKLGTLGWVALRLVARFRGSMFNYFAEDRTVNILTIITILVFFLHGFAWISLQFPVKNKPHQTLKLIEATFIPVSITKPQLIPPPPSPQKQQSSKPIQRKLKIKAAVPIKPTQSEYSAVSQIAESALVTPITPEPSVISQEIESPTKNTEHLTEVTIDTQYTSNPKPNYPSIALRYRWQGQVLLRVDVTEEGISKTVTIQQSSGHELLDEAATEAVKQWHFNPAKRGEIAIASSVIVPIVFTLDDQIQS